jgi:type 2 lantibiotic biosynthesis protein LanM
MDPFYERLIVRAATIDELLSDDFEPMVGQKGDADLAGRRLSAWCQSCASGDWSLFGRRLEWDGLTFGGVLKRFATVRRKTSAPAPAWIDDAIWIETALQSDAASTTPSRGLEHAEPHAFEQLFMPMIERADALLWSDIDARARDNLSESARADLRASLLRQLSDLSTPALYERFVKVRKAAASPADAAKPPSDVGQSRYEQFVAEMKAGGFRLLFADKPVLLRLMAVVTRQWIDASREFIVRLDADLTTIRRDLLRSDAGGRVVRIEGDLSDPHNGGRTVQVVGFEDGSRIVYKPKDLRIDVAWHTLIERLNDAGAPITLRAMRALARDGYGWTEFIEHTGCADQEGFGRFFQRSGAWLALFHCFAATDMHQENMIAAGDQPVPIDLEMILQATADEQKSQVPEEQASDAAMEIIANSVMMVGLLPAYGRSPGNKVFAIGGMASDWNSKTIIKWENVNSDEMRPTKEKAVGNANPNLPHVDGRYAKSSAHIDDFVAGFEAYAKFLSRAGMNTQARDLFDSFAGLPVRRLVRPTRFYAMLLQRLKNHQTMDDGAVWSAQADFIARLAAWEKKSDPHWPLQQAERSALIALNVPRFASPSNGTEIRDADGASIRTEAKSGLERARARFQGFDEREIAWQIEVIWANTNTTVKSVAPPASCGDVMSARAAADGASAREIFIAEADWIAGELSRCAIRRDPGAAWIGLDWLGDSEAFQLVCLGPDLYNGVSGIAVFLAAHAAVTNNAHSRDLALAGVSYLRTMLRGPNAARMARSVGVGGAAGLGSIVYALSVMSNFLGCDDLLADAQAAAELFTDDLIAGDKQLDVIGGSAGAILGLLRLYRDTRLADVLGRATRCGEHLIASRRHGPEGRRSWIGQGFGTQGLNGMSHGAAGFAYALASLSAATGREEFAQAASECIAFENSSYDAERHNWPDLRGGGEPFWPCQWCHGAAGIGLARLATVRRRGMDAGLMTRDARNAVEGVKRGWRGHVDTLCCGALGNIEFFCEAGNVLGRGDLQELASLRLMEVVQSKAVAGDYRWNSGVGKFNLGLFRGLAGVGYTLLRQLDASLPNIIVWE